MSKGKRCPLAMYSKAKTIKINVDTSSTQKASIASAYDVKNCSNAVSTTENRKQAKVSAVFGRMKYLLKDHMNRPSGIAATARYVTRPEKNRHRRYVR